MPPYYTGVDSFCRVRGRGRDKN